METPPAARTAQPSTLLFAHLMLLAVAFVALVATFALWRMTHQPKFQAGSGAILAYLLVPGVAMLLSAALLPRWLRVGTLPIPWLGWASVGLRGWATLAVAVWALLPASGAVNPGWYFLMAFSPSEVGGSVTLLAAGVLLGALGIGLEAIQTVIAVHQRRRVRWSQLPVGVWALYARAVVALVATPVLASTMVLLLAERTLSLGLFDPAWSGDASLFAHALWFGLHPLLLSAVIPLVAMAIHAANVGRPASLQLPMVQRIALMSAVLLGGAASGQHVLGTSALAQVASSLFGALGLAAVAAFVMHALLVVTVDGQPASRGGLGALLTLALSVAFLVRAALALPVVSRGADVWLYGQTGLWTLAAACAAGLWAAKVVYNDQPVDGPRRWSVTAPAQVSGGERAQAR